MSSTRSVQLSEGFRSLFPAGVVAAEMSEFGDTAMLLPEEALCLGRAVPKRAREFAAGRECARRALLEFGVVGFPLRAAADRRPLWPKGIVGSITHTAGLCAAVVAEAALFVGIGIDAEVVGDVRPDIWRGICTRAEIDWLASLPAAERARAAALIFAAKEAFYKAQYPIVGEFLGFQDVFVAVPVWGGTEAAFAARPLRQLAIARYLGARAEETVAFAGRFRFHGQFVSAGLAIAPVNMPCRPGTP